MNPIPPFAIVPTISRFFRVGYICLGLFSASFLSAAEPLPLPDTVQFKEEARLPLGVKDRTLLCSIIAENDTILVVETSSVPGITVPVSIDKALIAEVKKGDPSLRPFADISPELALPPESRDAVYYDDKIDRIFRPFLKKYPQGPQAEKVRAAEKVYSEEFDRVTKGEFRVGARWTQKSFLTPIDLTAIKLLLQTREEATEIPLDKFKKLADEARTCFASEFFPVLGKSLDQASDVRLAKLKNIIPPPADLEDRKKAEVDALIPISGWDWDSLNQAVAMVWEAETMLKNNPPDLIAKPLDLIQQSHTLMPFLIARDRIIRQQAAAYGEKGMADAKAGNRAHSLSWWSAALQLAAQLTPPENQTLTLDVLTLFEKSFTAQASAASDRREYGDATSWLTDMEDLMTKYPGSEARLREVKKRIADFALLIKKQGEQQVIDNMRKSLAEYQVRNNFESAKILLTTRWEDIKKLQPTEEETSAIAHAALDQAASAFKALRPITGCQLLKLAHDISPEDPRVKTWILTACLTALALFLFLLFPIFWIFARGGVILENFRYRWKLKNLRKKNPKKGPDLGTKRR